MQAASARRAVLANPSVAKLLAATRARAARAGAAAALAIASAAALAPAALVPAARAADAPDAALAVQEVAPGVFLHRGEHKPWGAGGAADVANLGFVVGGRCVAVIDTGGAPETGRRLRAAIARATPLPVCYVINTHVHPDHLLGNAAFASPQGGAAASPTASPTASPAASPTASPTASPAAAPPAAVPPEASTAPVFVAHARLPAALAAREPYYLNALRRDFGAGAAAASIPRPTLLVDGVRELDLGGRTLRLQAWPTAHTDNDLTVYDARTRTLFASDLLFVEHLPVLDGSLRGWLRVMDELRGLDVALVIPGHGPASTRWPDAMAPQRRYLEALLTQTREAIRAGATIGEAVERVGADAARGWQLADAFHRRNATTAFAELEWEN